MRNFKIKKGVNVYFTFMFLIILLVLKKYYDASNTNPMTWLKINSIIGWFIFAWGLISWKNLRNEIISLYSIFFTALFLFTFGQSLLIIFDLVEESRDLLFRFSYSQLLDAQFFTLFSLLAFHLGALVVCKKPNQRIPEIYNNKLNRESNDIIDKTMINAIKYTGLVLFALSFPGFIYSTIKTIQTIAQGGYGALYGYHTGGLARKTLILRIFEETAKYLIPSMICLIIGYKDNKKVRVSIFIILILNVINELYVGGRNGAMIIILIMILMNNYSSESIKERQIVKLGVYFYFILKFFNIVATLRGAKNRRFVDYLVTFGESFGKSSLFFNTISEMGWSMFPLGAVMSLVPNTYEYLYGKSYLYAVTSIIPNLGFWKIHPAKVYAGGGQWLMDTLNLWSGPGFTLIADAYRNFGWNGFIVLFAFGALFGGIYSSVDTFTIHEKPQKLCIVMIFFATTLISVRGDNLHIVRPLFYIVIPISLLIKIIYNYLSTKKTLVR